MHPVKVNSPYYASTNRAPAEAQTTNLSRDSSANRLRAAEVRQLNVPECSVSATNERNAESETNSTLQSNKSTAVEGPRPLAATEGETREHDARVTATAFVSYCHADSMLIARVLIAGELQEAHLDSCASHCFVSSAMSQHLTSIGYPAIYSPVCFEVKQGNPLCDTNLVHFAPLSIVMESGAVSTWNNCLFLVADAGAPIILCYSLLRLGGILSYEPPHGYERILERAAGTANAIASLPSVPSGPQSSPFAAMRGGTYYYAPSSTTPPAAPHQRAAKCLATDAECNPCSGQDGGMNTEIRPGIPNHKASESPLSER